MKKNLLNILFLGLVITGLNNTLRAQALVDNPCSLPAGGEWSLNSGCINVTTAGMTPLFNTGTCNSSAVDDGWAWFTGDGNDITINFVADAGFDPVLHVFEHTAPCSVLEVDCADNTLDGGTETVTFTSTLGQAYLIRLEDWNTSNTMTGCLEVISNIPVTNLTDNPCSLPALSEWTPGDPCTATSTAGFSHLFDPGTCGSGAFNDGWAWYTGTGAGNTITYTADPGVDITLHLFEADVSSGCNVTQIGCVNDNGAGGSETITGGGTLGQLYFIRIQSVGSNATATGCLEVTENPPTCDDGIQNGAETGVDCGGGCPANCPPPTTSTTDNCSNTTNTPVGMVTCAVLGSAAFEGLTGTVNYTATVQTSNEPSPAPGCGPNWNGQGNFATWAKYDLDAGITSASLDWEISGTGTEDIFITYYQGADCGSLTNLGCELFLDHDGVEYLSQNVMVTGLDDSQPLWILAFSAAAFDVPAKLRGFSGEPTNNTCATSEVASLNGCNVGAVGAAFTPPSAALGAGACSGGEWYTNENTVFYEFTPTATDATLQIDAVTCNGETIGGLAQFGIWESCADVGTYGTEFMGCVVGDDTLELTGMTIGQTYIVVFDGNAGDLCRWEFRSTGGILLEADLLSFDANYNDHQGVVDIEWMVAQEDEVEYYQVEKSTDGIHFDFLTEVPVTNNGPELTKTYAVKDNTPVAPISYYRLKSINANGSYADYSDIVAVTVPISDGTGVAVYPNPIKNNGLLFFDAVKNGEIWVEIFDITGQKISTQAFSAKVGQNQFELQTDDLVSGVYLLMVGDTETKRNIRFVKN